MKTTLTERLYRRELYAPGSRGSKVRSVYANRDWVRDLDIVNELDGHSGCVNALSWSKSGRLLASGSDDQHLNIHTYQPDHSTSQFALTATVATGHTQNIFSVKFMPHSNDQTVVTVAGDGEVRVFDLEYAGTSRAPSNAAHLATEGRRRGRGHIYNGVRYMNDGDTNCRVYRSHGDRVKRVVTESSPHLFLTCSEDGEVRQWDLRQPSSAYPPPGQSNVPPPLISYKRYHLDLNTISCSASQPHYIALGGAHLHCFLHDRRMLGRDRLHERGSTSVNTLSDMDDDLLGQATHCVRKFAPNGQPRMRRTDNGHITACKISDANPNEMIVSWSGEHVYAFDLMRSPDACEMQRIKAQTQTAPARRAKEDRDGKRKRRGSGQLSQDGGERAQSRQRTEDIAPTDAADGGLALRVQYGNGQSEDIPIDTQGHESPIYRSQEIVVTNQHRTSYRLAKISVNLRLALFTLGIQRQTTEIDPTGHKTSFTSVLGYAASILPDMIKVCHGWRYPVDPSNVDVALQRTLRQQRDSAARFVQAAGTIARALGGEPRTASPLSNSSHFQRIHSVASEGPDVPRHEQFCYDFIKAILLWLDSGIGALLEGFTKPSQPHRQASRFPVPHDASAEAIDEVLIPYLLQLASQRPIVSVDASRFEVDQNRVLYSTEQGAVLAFAAALNTPFADLSSAVVLSSASESADPASHQLREPMQDRRAALQHWGLRVARALLMNAGEGVNFALVDRAFGGLGRTDAQVVQEEAQQRERHENIDPDDDEPAVQAARFIRVGATETAPSPSAMSMEEDEDLIAMSDIRAMIEDAEEEDGDDEEVQSNSAGQDESDDEDEEADDDSDDNDDHAGDDSDEDEQDPEPGFPNVVYRSAFERRRLKERVEDDVPCIPHTRVYRGHCNVKTVKDVNYFGLEDEYVVSGSDDGNLFIWDRKTSQLVNILEGDGEVVNVTQGHPYEPMLAVSGIDNTIKIFSPDARAREAARLGKGVEAADATAFSSIAWPARMRGRRFPRPGGHDITTSEPAMADTSAARPSGEHEDEHDDNDNDDDDEFVAPNGLSSRKRMNLEYQITSHNDVERQGGNQEAYITVSDLLRYLAGGGLG